MRISPETEQRMRAFARDIRAGSVISFELGNSDIRYCWRSDQNKSDYIRAMESIVEEELGGGVYISLKMLQEISGASRVIVTGIEPKQSAEARIVVGDRVMKTVHALMSSHNITKGTTAIRTTMVIAGIVRSVTPDWGQAVVEWTECDTEDGGMRTEKLEDLAPYDEESFWGRVAS